MNGERGHPIVEIVAEAALAHRLDQIAVRGGDDSHVHLEHAGAPYTFELAVLEDTQELGLKLEGKLGDLVEEEGPPVGQLEAAGWGRRRAGEGALLVTEQLALIVSLTGDWPGRAQPAATEVTEFDR